MNNSIDSESIYYQNIPENVINVPAVAKPEDLNLLLNNSTRQVNDDWEDLVFDFLIDDLLLRSSLNEFAEENSLTTESTIRIECILREPPPASKNDLQLSDWVSDIKVFDKFLFVGTYDGKFSIWGLDGSLLYSGEFDDDPMKCLDVFTHANENYAIIGAQNQTLVLCKINVTKKRAEVQPLKIYRGHERSVECVSANSNGSRIISGSFDSCLKVWNSENDNENVISSLNSKKAKFDINKLSSQTPMVTLAAHREVITSCKWNSLNDSQAITASWDHSIILWDLELAGPVNTLNFSKSFTSLSVSPFSGCIISGCSDPIVRLFDIRSREGSMVKQSFFGHTGWISNVCWSQSNEYLFVSTSFDNLTKIWDIRSPKTPLYDLTGHQDRILALDWSTPHVIATGGADCTLKTYHYD